MNYPLFLFLLNLILLSRLRLTFKDGGASGRDVVIMAAIPLASLFFIEFSAGWLALLIYFMTYPFLVYRVEKSAGRRAAHIARDDETDESSRGASKGSPGRDGTAGNINRNRILILLMHVLVIGLICSPLFPTGFNRFPDWIGRGLQNLLLDGQTLTETQVLNIQVLIFGILLVINEMNTLLRWLLGVFRLDSFGDQNSDIGRNEYNTGRVIGLLERIFVLTFVLLNHFSAIGFILAAKGVTRFQDFRDRLFAEYVLIGTLLSTLLAMLTAFFVQMIWS